MNEVFDVSIEDTASPEDEEAVRALFAESGVHAAVKRTIGRKSLDDHLPWIVDIRIPLATFLTAFTAELGRRAAQKAPELARDFMTRLFELRSKMTQRPGALTLRSDHTIVLGHDLPSEAWETLGTIEKLPPGYAVFVRDRGRWMSSGELR